MTVMSTAELDIEQIRTTITKLNAETLKLLAESSKLHSESTKLQAESRKFTTEVFWYPVAIAAAFGGAVAAVAVALTKLLS
jgi:hypothetical protein